MDIIANVQAPLFPRNPMQLPPLYFKVFVSVPVVEVIFLIFFEISFPVILQKNRIIYKVIPQNL